MKKIQLYLSALAMVASLQLRAQSPVAIMQLNTPFFNNMDSLATAGMATSSPLPTGWLFVEAGTGANNTYGINDGANNAGNTYSYGTTASTDRALGSLASGALQSTICTYYINQTGSHAAEVRLQFTMEQWRSGGRTTPDSSEFFWGVNNGGFLPANGTWNKNSALNLVSKIFSNPAPTAGARNGNDTANQIKYDVTITGVNLQPGDTIYFRWRDPDLVGSDDGLAIDDFSITFIGSVTQPQAIQNILFTANDSRSANITLSRGIYIPSNMSTLVFVKKGAAINTAAPSRSPAEYTANANFSLATSPFEHDTAAKCVLNGDETTFTISGLELNTTYYLLAYVVRDVDTVYSNARTGTGTTLGIPDSVRNMSTTVFSQTEATINWQQAPDYQQATYTTLVFVKANSTIQFATPTLSADQYNAQSNFALSTSKFEHDTAARCVLNGDSTQLQLSGLDTNTLYHFLVLTYRSGDSLYSAPVTGSFQTFDQSFVPALINLSVSGIDSTQAQISWNLPTSFNTNSNRVIVFAKSSQPINAHTPTQNVQTIIANASFGLGSIYEGDAQAFAVYNGSGSGFLLTGLMPSTTYHLVGFVVRVADSTYSSTINNNFTTIAGPPRAVINPVFTQAPSRSGTLSWQKPTDYNNATHSTLVFAKAGSNITTGNTLGTSISYTASSTFGVGTPYDFDNEARCVFNGDTNFINLNNLPFSGDLSFVIHIIRQSDAQTSAPVVLQHTITLPLPVGIGSINTTNPVTGVPDSSGRSYTVEGAVIGFNQRLSGLQFLIRDNTGGITILSTANTFGYTVSEGDTVRCTGTIISNRGLLSLQIDTLQRIYSHSGTFNPLPNVVNRLNEASENRLVRIGVPVRFVSTPSGSNWPSVSANIRVVDAITQTDTFTIRLLSLSALAGKPLPTAPIFIVSGIGSQSSSSASAPFAFDGYQIIPRGEVDIRPADSLSTFGLLTPTNNTVISLDSPFTEVITVSWQPSIPSGTLSAPMYFFELDLLNGDFSSPMTTVPADNGGMNTTLTIDESSILALLADMGLSTGDVFLGKWRIVAQSSYATRVSSQVFNVTINMPASVGLRSVQQSVLMNVYPNPAKDMIQVVTDAAIQYININDMQGKMWVQQHASNSIDINQLPKGVYMIQVQLQDGNTVYSRFIKQ
jgi:hypothetical protein